MRLTKLTATLLLGGSLMARMGACSSEKVGPPPAPPVNWASLQVVPVADAGEPKATEKERAEYFASEIIREQKKRGKDQQH